MRNIIRTICLILCLAVALTVISACGGASANNAVQNNQPADNIADAPAALPEQNNGMDGAQDTLPAYDREGFPITLPERIDTIISIGPSNTEVLAALGFGDAIIQTDRHSADVPGIRPEIATFDLMSLDLEYIINLAPDIVFVTGLTRAGGEEDPLRQVTATGITVIYMPSSASIADIKEDIRFMAAVMRAASAGEEIVEYMSREIDRIREIAQTAAERRKVYFEIAPAPNMISFGAGTFLNEIIEIAGGVNIFADKEGWVRISDEGLFESNPDVILTSVDFIDDPIGEIMGRPGWSALTAVQNGDVFAIDTGASNRPNHNIIIALQEIAAAIHPDKFQ